jgi:ribosomal protein S27E
MNSNEVEEIAYEDFISNKINQEEKVNGKYTVKCNNCGATTTLQPNLYTSDTCAFCASPLVIQGGTTSTIIKPKYLLPFKIDD